MSNDLILLHSAFSPRARDAAVFCARRAGQSGFSTTVSDLSSFSSGELLSSSRVLLFLDVQETENLAGDAAPFWLHLNSLNPGSLRNLRFAIFAFRDACHGQFCALGNACNMKLAHLGASRIHPFTTGGDRPLEILSSWFEGILEKIGTPARTSFAPLAA